MRARACLPVGSLLGLVLVGCSASGGAAVPSPSAVRSSFPSPAPSASSVPAEGAVPDAILAPVLADAATRTGLAPGSIALVEGTAMTWNNGSLGCPKPGVMYTQALVDGYRIVLEAAGTRLDYRARANGGFIVCEGLLSH